jgi:hypothetical protein
MRQMAAVRLKRMLLPPKTGEMIVAAHSCVAWGEDLEDEVDSLRRGDLLLVIQMGSTRFKKRLNSVLYAKVVTPRGAVGWVHIDNCFSE